jgi:putative CocE/NonD family hydrolase
LKEEEAMRWRTKADTQWWESEGMGTRSLYKGIERSSRYITMRDGVKIAIDLYLPKNIQEGEQLPTVLNQTRYFRRTIFKWPFGWLMEWRSPFKQAVNRLISHGYACVIVDARGSGASFGFRQMEWSPDEVKDGAEVLDWVVQQPWSNGTVASTGISYDGTAAEMFLVNRHPAVKAAIIRYALFNVYTDIIHPGGVRNEGFMQTWSASNAHLDRNDLASFARQHISPLAGLAVQGVAPTKATTISTRPLMKLNSSTMHRQLASGLSTSAHTHLLKKSKPAERQFTAGAVGTTAHIHSRPSTGS